jgi:hypothetical protein
MNDADPILDLLRVWADTTRPAHERSQAGRTLASRVLKRCQQIDAEELARLRDSIRRDADRFAANRTGDA